MRIRAEDLERLLGDPNPELQIEHGAESRYRTGIRPFLFVQPTPHDAPRPSNRPRS